MAPSSARAGVGLPDCLVRSGAQAWGALGAGVAAAMRDAPCAVRRDDCACGTCSALCSKRESRPAQFLLCARTGSGEVRSLAWALAGRRASGYVQACTYRKDPDFQKPVMSGSLKPCFVAPGYPGIKDIWDHPFLERPRSLTGSTFIWGTVAYLQPPPQSDSQGWGTPASGRICGWLAPDPSSVGLQSTGCWRLAEGVCTTLAPGMVPGNQGSGSRPASGEARSLEWAFIGNKHLLNSKSQTTYWWLFPLKADLGEFDRPAMARWGRLAWGSSGKRHPGVLVLGESWLLESWCGRANRAYWSRTALWSKQKSGPAPVPKPGQDRFRRRCVSVVFCVGNEVSANV